MKKALCRFVVIPLLFSAGILLAGEEVGHYSNMRVSADTGDCGGFQLWLKKSGQTLGGELAAFEGDCGPVKKKLEDVKYDAKTGALSFRAVYMSDDFYCTFKGTLKRDRVAGTISVFQKQGNEKPHSEMVNLLKEE